MAIPKAEAKSPTGAFLAEMAPAQTNITLATFSVMCGLRSDEWFQPFMSSYQQYTQEAANRYHMGNDGLDAADAQSNKIEAELRTKYTCRTLTNSPMMDKLDGIRDKLSFGYR